MGIRAGCFAGTALAAIAAFSAFAGQPSLEERVRALEQRLGTAPPPGASLEERVRAIEERLAEEDRAGEERLTEPKPAIPERPAQAGEEDQPAPMRLATPEPQVEGPAWTLDNSRPTVRSADGRFLMSIRARFQFDTALFNQDSDISATDAQVKDLASGAITRRAYLGIEGRAFRDFWYEYRMDFGGANAEGSNPILNLARISYNIGDINNPFEPHLRLNAGIIQPIFTFEDTISSSSVTFLERASVVTVATAGYGGLEPRRGIELTFQQTDIFRRGDNLLVSGAFTGQQPSGNNPAVPTNTTDEGTQILGRAAYRVWSDGFSNIQFGVNGAEIVNVTGSPTPGGARLIVLQDRPELRVDGNRLVSTGGIPARGGWLWGLDAEMNVRNFYLAGEYYRFGIERDTSCTSGGGGPGGACLIAGDPVFSGWYVAATWILTGETKTYQPIATNNEMATFNNPRVMTPFSLGRSWGTWEVAARYSDLDLNWNAGTRGTACAGALIGCVRGGEQKIWTFGLNWYLNNNIRMLFDYMIIDVDRLNAAGDQIGQRLNAIGARLQYTN